MYNVRKKEGREQEMYKEVEGKKMRAEGKNEEKRRTSNTTSQPASPHPIPLAINLVRVAGRSSLLLLLCVQSKAYYLGRSSSSSSPFSLHRFTVPAGLNIFIRHKLIYRAQGALESRDSRLAGHTRQSTTGLGGGAYIYKSPLSR